MFDQDYRPKLMPEPVVVLVVEQEEWSLEVLNGYCTNKRINHSLPSGRE